MEVYMSDNKEYISRSEADGSINISEEVIGIIALEAMSEVEGFGGASTTIGKELAELLGKKSAFKGIRVTVIEGDLNIDAYINVKYGYAVTKTAKNIQDAIYKAVSDMTGITVKAVNVHVNGITFDKDK
jgi:uncharacterized alkaline shock family protein YloU